MSQSSFHPVPGGAPVVHGSDESAPPGGGIFRRIAPGEGSGSSWAGVFQAVEVAFAPGARAAREELQRQRTAGARNPSATDPPDGDDAGAATVAAPGRPGTPFSGWIVIGPPKP